ncbi:MAG: hypothetical protein DRQ10_00095 [Candidatus Hydrothermota bacterium]|nr:MAG: hypothetical protein DRQ10_00095 [Candidatus Hydrothermae bacterium]
MHHHLCDFFGFVHRSTKHFYYTRLRRSIDSDGSLKVNSFLSSLAFWIGDTVIAMSAFVLVFILDKVKNVKS